MTLMDSLSAQGIEISPAMAATTIIKYVSSLSTLKLVFPNVFSMIDTLQGYVDNYNSAVKALDKAQGVVDDAQAKLLQAKDMYNKMLNTPTAYTCPGGLTPAPIIPTSTIAYHAAIETAQKFLDQAEQALEKARQKVHSIEDKIENYKDSIVNKLMSIKV